MQSLMFVFVGVTGKGSNADISLLFERIATAFKENKIGIELRKKDDLIIGNFEDTSYYISIIKDINHLKDWYQLAIDFELRLDKNPVNRTILLSRYSENSLRAIYKAIHFGIGLLIFDEMQLFADLLIYSFQ
jgi:hypothetical protein